MACNIFGCLHVFHIQQFSAYEKKHGWFDFLQNENKMAVNFSYFDFILCVYGEPIAYV